MSIDWKSVLARHPLFDKLEPKQIDELVATSIDRTCKPNEIIFREGETGTSLFLIGSGEVEVVLLREDDHRIPVATMPAGDVFGEMAVLERKPRSATVVASQDTTLLEIDGHRYLKILRKQPKLELQMMSMLSERLRRLTEGVVAAKFSELNRKYGQLEAKVERDLDKIRNAQRITDLLREDTKERVQEITQRANEVIEQTNRSQERLFQAIKIVGLVAGVASIAVGAMGYKTWDDVTQSRDKVVAAAETIDELKPAIEELKGGLRLYREFFEPQLYKTLAVDVTIQKHLRDNYLDDARDVFATILESGSQEVSEYLLQWVMVEILKGEKNRKSMKQLLVSIRDDLPRYHYRDRFLIEYLLLSAYVIDGEMGRFEDVRSEFNEHLEDYSGESIRRSLEVDLSPDNFRGHFYASGVTRSKRLGEPGELGRIKERATNKAEPIRQVWNDIP
jgi:CRP/FNR family transcriptional regulator/CRP/FNR family cyclic AMP-dependent transcriptional regulator